MNLKGSKNISLINNKFPPPYLVIEAKEKLFSMQNLLTLPSYIALIQKYLLGGIFEKCKQSCLRKSYEIVH